MAECLEDVPCLQSRDDLVAWLEAGCKPKSKWRIGTEHEKFGFHTDDLSPVPYDGPRGIGALLQGMRDKFGWDPIMEGANIIGLKQPQCPLGGSITLEPGGQFELSGAPLENVHDTCREVNDHLRQVREVGDELGIGFLGLGFSPKSTLQETPMMPKGRYKIMRDYMGRVGTLGRDMMFRSCTVQVNLDFSSEADMVKKFRVSLALQPITTAIFANSPFTEGKPNGFLSYRSELWRDTDADRTGMLPFVFEDGFGFERYADYALQVPMYFVYRHGKYINATGHFFSDFLRGDLKVLPGEKPTESDWSDHLTTLFPEVRMKQFLEMRGADAGSWRRLCALPAFWTGLLYDGTALDAAWDLVKDWSAEERQALRDDVPVRALATPFRNGTVGDIALEAVEIARAGMKARNLQDSLCQDESQYLEFLRKVVRERKTHAEMLLDQFHDDWNGDIDRVFKEHAF